MFKQEGYDFMGAAFEVYNEQGYGMVVTGLISAMRALTADARRGSGPFKSNHSTVPGAAAWRM